jgi:sec-independent protein translocase protein TatB
MFGIDSSELAIVALVALLVIGPKDLPRVMRMVGNWIAKGRAMSRHVRAGFDTMMREAELEEMQKAWAAQNEAIMKATALPDPIGNSMAGIDPASWALPDPLAPDPLAADPFHEEPVIVPALPAPAPAAEAPAKKPRAPRKKKTAASDVPTKA